jgi:hypothetical protein
MIPDLITAGSVMLLFAVISGALWLATRPRRKPVTVDDLMAVADATREPPAAPLDGPEWERRYEEQQR